MIDLDSITEPRATLARWFCRLPRAELREQHIFLANAMRVVPWMERALLDHVEVCGEGSRDPQAVDVREPAASADD